MLPWNRPKAEFYHSSELSERKKLERQEEKEKADREKEREKKEINERKRKSIPTSKEWKDWKEKNSIIMEERNGGEEFMIQTKKVRKFLNKEKTGIQENTRCECGLVLKKFISKQKGPNRGRELLGCPDGFEGCGYKRWLPLKIDLETRLSNIEDKIKDLSNDLWEMQKIVIEKPYKPKSGYISRSERRTRTEEETDKSKKTGKLRKEGEKRPGRKFEPEEGREKRPRREENESPKNDEKTDNLENPDEDPDDNDPLNMEEFHTK